MSNKSRQGIRPAFLAAVLGVAAMLAVVAVLALPSGPAHAQSSPFDPPAPTGVNAAANSDGTEVTVTWTAGTGGAPASGYEVERKVGSSSYESADPAHTGTTASYTDSNVSDGMTYMYRVRATNNFGQSNWVGSNEVTVTAPATSVDAPMGVAAVHGGQAGQVVVEWIESMDVDSYEVTYREVGGTVMADSTDATSPHTISGLMAQTEYEVCVIAVVGSDRSVPACDTATTSRYLLTFDQRQFTGPDRADPQDIAIDAAPGGEVTVRGTVWIPDLEADSERTDTLAVRFTPDDIEVETANLLAVSDNSKDDGELTIRPRDDDKRSFEMTFECDPDPTVLTISIYDDDVQRVEIGTITLNCPEPVVPTPDDETTQGECYSVTGYMGDDEDEALDQMRDDIEPHERPAHATNPEMGQDTIQILEGSADVQITVTSCEKGPVYIRFLDSDGDVFGTDIDECETCEGASGADVVGLDSQQKLELNLGPTQMDAAMALMYDQYNVITPGAGGAKYLVGKSGMYYQGTFRFIAPCDWEPFEVEVYEKNGKVLQELENGMFSQTVSCVAPEVAEAQPIEVVQGSRADREMIVRWEPIADAVEYTVAVLDTSDPAMYTVAFAEMFPATATREVTVSGLTSGTRYIYAVYAELPGGTYSPVEFVINTPEF